MKAVIESANDENDGELQLKSRAAYLLTEGGNVTRSRRATLLRQTMAHGLDGALGMQGPLRGCWREVKAFAQTLYRRDLAQDDCGSRITKVRASAG